MINELLAAAILSTSFSVRSPNDATKPLDYEFMVKAEKTEGNFTWSFKKDWERELGEKYVDDILKFTKKLNKDITEKVLWPKLFDRMKRYKPFLSYNITKFKISLRDKLKEI